MESYGDLRASFSEEHAPRREHDVPWIYLPDIRAVAEGVVRRAKNSLLSPVRRFDPLDVAYVATRKLQALRELVFWVP
jgi:hypothetical protein